MIFWDQAEHHTYINVCVELDKSLVEIKQLLKKTQCDSSVLEPQSIDGTDVFRRFLGPTQLKRDWKTYRNRGKCDVKCVEFTTTWC